jgi:hypothetical protein
MIGTTTFEAIVVLMIKFDKSEEIRCSGFLFQTVRFQQFQNINMA